MLEEPRTKNEYVNLPSLDLTATDAVSGEKINDRDAAES